MSGDDRVQVAASQSTPDSQDPKPGPIQKADLHSQVVGLNGPDLATLAGAQAGTVVRAIERPE